MTRRHTKIILAAALVATFAIANVAFAETAATSTPSQFTIWNLFNFPDECKLATYNYTLDAFIMIAAGLMWGIISITGSLAVLMFMYGGVQLLISQGEKGKIASAKTTIKNAVIGIGLILGAWLIVNTVIGFLIDPSKLPTAASEVEKGITITNADKTVKVSVGAFDKVKYWGAYMATPCVSVVSETIRKAPEEAATPKPPAANECVLVNGEQRGLEGDITCEQTCLAKAKINCLIDTGFVKKVGSIITEGTKKYGCCVCEKTSERANSVCGQVNQACGAGKKQCNGNLICGSGNKCINPPTGGAQVPVSCGVAGAPCCDPSTGKAKCGAAPEVGATNYGPVLACDEQVTPKICRGDTGTPCNGDEDCQKIHTINPGACQPPNASGQRTCL